MNQFQANLCLLCVTLCWSTEVIIFACIPVSVSPFAVTCVTSLVGGALLLLAFFRRVRAALADSWKRLLRHGLDLGVLNCAYNVLYQFGLKDFDVSTGAFTLCITVTLLPFVMLFQRRRVEKKTWLSAFFVMAGIICASVGAVTRAEVPGLLVITAGCVLRAVFILKLNRYARENDPVVLSVAMSVIIGSIGFGMWFVTQPATFSAIPWSPSVIACLAVYSYFIISFAQTLNVFAQRRAKATDATIIYALEIVFSVIWGIILPPSLIDPVKPTPHLLLGLLFVLLGNLVELVDLKRLFKRQSVGEGSA